MDRIEHSLTMNSGLHKASASDQVPLEMIKSYDRVFRKIVSLVRLEHVKISFAQCLRFDNIKDSVADDGPTRLLLSGLSTGTTLVSKTALMMMFERSAFYTIAGCLRTR